MKPVFSSVVLACESRDGDVLDGLVVEGVLEVLETDLLALVLRVAGNHLERNLALAALSTRTHGPLAAADDRVPHELVALDLERLLGGSRGRQFFGEEDLDLAGGSAWERNGEDVRRLGRLRISVFVETELGQLVVVELDSIVTREAAQERAESSHQLCFSLHLGRSGWRLQTARRTVSSSGLPLERASAFAA
jgi:hypothetical protein